ncbi:FtsX-like permease family protein [Flavihumibacter sp. ZG627]|uniref:FtsX-like permease family protein n=1 Tax=Flavihumibacter sp. ZG627 TaxID=1463156 RepID=UPI00057D0DE0|nr:FtsX-like permease family protein [Flavihumibacter sp. ZG627]KIC90119.1 hypothetical protein HY58_12200 [Flavihumibacter sp. ZG627]
MLFNYFKIAFRNLRQNRIFSLVNIAGLTIGMAATLLIFLWVYHERSWNKHNEHYQDVYHVYANRDFNGQITSGPDMMFPLPAAAAASFPEVEEAVIVDFGGTPLFTVGDKMIRRQTLTTSPEFFNVFSAQFIEGSAKVLQDPDALVVTESTAIAFFGHTRVIGETVKVNNGRSATIKAVVKDLPENSTVRFEVLQPFNQSTPEYREAQTDWVNCGNRVFFLVKPGANIASLEKKTLELIRKNASSENVTTRGSIILHPMSKWRLYEEFRDGRNTGGRIAYVKLFTWVAIIILLIACVNFMNLSTARSEKRAKEVGIRKTLGSGRKQLLLQFISESVLLAIIAFILASLVVWLVLPAFGQLLNQEINIPFNEPSIWIIILSIILLTGIIAGSYPAIYLSSFRPVKVLKGTFLPGKKALLPRKILVTAQFVISILLISATLIIYQQLQHVRNRELGYDVNNLVLVSSSGQAHRNLEAIRNDLRTTGMVESVTHTSSAVSDIFGFTSGIRWPGAPENNNLVIGFMFAGHDLAKTIGARMASGQDFRINDTNHVIFNQEAIKVMGIQDPVGREIEWAGRRRIISGVIENMVVNSPYTSASPAMIVYEPNWSNQINIRLNQGVDIRKALVQIEQVFSRHNPENPFEYRFMDEVFQEKFTNEKLIGQLALIFSALAIFVCCLGLFGLLAFSIERRSKEISIRKVLGASLQQLLLPMSAEFLVLIGLAFLIAIPAAWWAMKEWLNNFEYRVNISAGVFVLVGLIILLIAFITISLNASRAALSNPVKSLRSE